jgi:two-component system KDP operon response regulator KdpE
MTSASPRILIVDDDPAIRRFLRTSLTAHGYTALEASDGRAALVASTDHRPAVVILDLGLPDIQGVEIIRRVREWSDTPIIVLSVREREADKIEALDAGADDYVTKPFGMGELLARIRAVLRHRLRAQQAELIFRTGDLVIDLSRRAVTAMGVEVKLTPKEYDLLRVLVTHVGKVVTHRSLLADVWGPNYVRQTHYLRVYMRQLRQKLEPDAARPRYLLTEPGVGYRLIEMQPS